MASPFSKGVGVHESKQEVTTVASFVENGGKSTKCVHSLTWPWAISRRKTEYFVVDVVILMYCQLHHFYMMCALFISFLSFFFFYLFFFYLFFFVSANSVTQVKNVTWLYIGKLKRQHLRSRFQQYSFVEIDHENFSAVILSLPLIQEGQLSVSVEKNVHVWVNHILEDQDCQCC